MLKKFFFYKLYKVFERIKSNFKKFLRRPEFCPKRLREKETVRESRVRGDRKSSDVSPDRRTVPRFAVSGFGDSDESSG